MRPSSFLSGFDAMVLVYFVVLNSTYLILILLAAAQIVRQFRRAALMGYDDIFSNPLSPPVSVIVPAHNEEAVIVDSVRAMLALHYSEFEVIVVDDGSTDATFARLQSAFNLQPIDRVLPGQFPTMGEVFAIYGSASGENLVVARKESVGRRSDAVNAGIDLARYPLICMVDADSILEENALLRVAKPFVDDPEHVIATGGVIRVANGTSIYRGKVEDVRHSRRLLARIQTVEYVRSFLLGRLGWSRLQARVIISGAFGLFRKDLVIKVGGLDLNSIGEDAELVITLHEYMRAEGRDYRVVFVPEPVAWTEAPETLRQLGRQRRRWSRGLAQITVKHRKMIGNPRYGRIGLLAIPYYVLFELLSPVIETLGVVAVAVGLATGVLNWSYALWFGLVAVAYGLFVSACALTIEELAFHRYHRLGDLQRSFGAALLENLGYRQLHAIWRLLGLFDEASGRKNTWAPMTRRGFEPPASLPTSSSSAPSASGAARVAVDAADRG
jgi:cellulose synthase/poly-beta-1,6-N-acetylglucosamine synthase-like glycosyltransferase